MTRRLEMDEANDKHCRHTSLRRESVISREPEQAEVRAQGAEQNFEIEEQSRVNETRGKRFNTRRRLDGKLSTKEERETIDELCNPDCYRFWCCCFAAGGAAAIHHFAVQT